MNFFEQNFIRIWMLSSLMLIGYIYGAPQVSLTQANAAIANQGNQGTAPQSSSQFVVFRDIDEQDFRSFGMHDRGHGSLDAGSVGRKLPINKSHLNHKTLHNPHSNSHVKVTKKKLTKNLHGRTKSHPQRNTYSIRRESLETFDDEFGSRENAGSERFRYSTKLGSQNRGGRVGYDFDDDRDNLSFEDILEHTRTMSLGRRFHPAGIPKRINEPVQPQQNTFATFRDLNSHPFVVSPEKALNSGDDSLELDIDDDEIVVLSPMLEVYNHQSDNEKLSLSNDFMNQYNFVDVQGTTNWGYKTDDQYQEHKVHPSGNMEGKFGWSTPEGANVKIEYIADENGYRVISSHGAFAQDTEEVRTLKDQHLSEHEKTIKFHNELRHSMGHTGTGVQNTKPVDNSNQFTVLPDNPEDIGLISYTPSLNQNTGIPLPPVNLPGTTSSGQPVSAVDSNYGTTNGELSPVDTGSIQPTDTNSNFGIPLPGFNNVGSTQDSGAPGTADAGISVSNDPVQDPAILDTTNTNSNFGIPLPGSNVGIIRDTLVPDTADVGSSVGNDAVLDQTVYDDYGVGSGVPLPTAKSTIDTTAPEFVDQNPGADNVAPIPDPSLFPDTTGGEFGVALPGPVTNTEITNFDQTIPGSNDGAGATPNVGVPVTDSTGELPVSGFGIPLPGSTDFNAAIDNGNTPVNSDGKAISNSGSNLLNNNIAPETTNEQVFPIEKQPVPTGQDFDINTLTITPGNIGSGSSIPANTEVANNEATLQFGIPLPSNVNFENAIPQNTQPISPDQSITNIEGASNFGTGIEIGNEGVDPCLNGKLHPSLLPLRCFQNEPNNPAQPTNTETRDTIVNDIQDSNITPSGTSGIPLSSNFPINVDAITPNAVSPSEQMGNKEMKNTNAVPNENTGSQGVPLFVMNTSTNELPATDSPIQPNITPESTQDNTNNQEQTGVDPCLNGKIHPSLLPAHCFENGNVDPSVNAIPNEPQINSGSPQSPPLNQGNTGSFGIPLPSLNLNVQSQNIDSGVPLGRSISAQPNAKIGKNLRRSTDVQSDNEQSFIVVVDTSMFK